jgi:hypothetical protein
LVQVKIHGILKHSILTFLLVLFIWVRACAVVRIATDAFPNFDFLHSELSKSVEIDFFKLLYLTQRTVVTFYLLVYR